ncbi:MAG: nucleotidyltransferase domain-containing protein [Candidatus Bathyarchaeia archaeon]|jgi:predicted nucleotidyltransferase
MKLVSMDLVSLTPQGRILLTLAHGQHTYAELKAESGLSDRWLTIKLQELVADGSVAKDGRWYRVCEGAKVSAYELSLFMRGQAQRVAAELGKLPLVELVVLFGSVAQRKAEQYSDIDLLIVAADTGEKSRGMIVNELRRLESTFHFAIESLILSEQDFAKNLRTAEGGIIFGLAEGFEVLLDRKANLSDMLQSRVQEILSSFTRLDEEAIWLKAK